MNSNDIANWQGYLTLREVTAIKNDVLSIAGKHGSGNIIAINIGGGAGTSAVAILEASKNVSCITVDILASGSETTTNDFLRMKEVDPSIASRHIRIWGNSQVIQFPYKFDYIFIDADHQADGLMKDIGWLKNLNVGGIVGFHDYGSPNWTDVKCVVDNFAVDMEEKYSKISQIDTYISFKKIKE